MRRELIFMTLIAVAFGLYAQKESDDLRAGNRHYKNKKYTEAEIEYRKALQKNSKSFEANYNLGNALFRQGKYEQALEQYHSAHTLTKDKEKLAYDFHNIGNALMSGTKYDKAIEAYKMALKNNPNDNETRYNLAYAQAQLKKQQDKNQNNGGGGDDKNNQDNKENNEPQKSPEKKQQEQQQEQPQPQMSKEQAQQILEALEQDEKETQDKAKNAQRRSTRKADKDW